MTKHNNLKLDEILDTISRTAPPILTRTEIERITGGAIKAKTLANIDSIGEGCIPDRLIIGRRVCYPTTSFIDWLRARTEVHVPREGTNPPCTHQTDC